MIQIPMMTVEFSRMKGEVVRPNKER